MSRGCFPLYALPFAGGRPRKIGTLSPFGGGGGAYLPAGLTVSPDDSRIVWNVGGEREIDLELISNFR
ncbi:MAG: hypothetical protein ABJF23_16825 [Bryobacteraceae bacterium]